MAVSVLGDMLGVVEAVLVHPVEEEMLRLINIHLLHTYLSVRHVSLITMQMEEIRQQGHQQIKLVEVDGSLVEVEESNKLVRLLVELYSMLHLLLGLLRGMGIQVYLLTVGRDIMLVRVGPG